MASGRLADYLGKGDAADRPASLSLHPEAVGFYYATDTEEWSAWDGSQWVPVVAGDVPAADEVTYDNAASGLSAADVQAAIDELAHQYLAKPDPVPEITGSTAGNAALESLLQELENAGIIVNNTTP